MRHARSFQRPPPISQKRLDAIIRSDIGVEPDGWTGTLNIYAIGKTGEILFASGMLPALRVMTPKASIVFHVHPHYMPMMEGLTHRPDSWSAYEWTGVTGKHTDRVAMAAKQSIRSLGGHLQVQGSDISTNLYNNYIPWSPRPFYRDFMAAVHIPDAPYAKPGWQPSERAVKIVKQLGSDRLAVAFASANAHNGSPLRSVPFTPEQWNALADRLIALGFLPVATGHSDDPVPVTPGWKWFDTNDISEVLTLLTKAAFVLGLNSGVVFAATQLAPGKTVMIDTQMKPTYAFQTMLADGLIDLSRHIQVSRSEHDLFKRVLDHASI